MFRVLVVVAVLFGLVCSSARADVFDDNPAAVSVGPGDVYVFARAGDGMVVMRHLSGGAWSEWVGVPGLVADSGPAAVVYGSSILLFAVGHDGSVSQNTLVNGSWLGWTSLGGFFTSAPAAALRPTTTTVDLVVRGSDNAMYHRTFVGGQGWGVWEGMPGANFTSAPAAAGYVNGQTELLARDARDGLNWFPVDGSTHSWSDLGGAFKGAPAAVTPLPGRLDVYVRALDDTLHYRPLQTAAWQRVDSTVLSGSPAPTSDQRGREFVFAVIGGQLQMLTASVSGSDPPVWGSWTPLGPIPSVGAPTVVVPPPPVSVPDADHDGVADAADQCAAVAGPALRSGCPTGLLADPSIRYRAGRRSIRVLAYYVKATSGARVVVTCSRGCRKTVTKGRGSKVVKIRRLSGRNLKNGTKITVAVSLAGRLTTTVVDRVRGGRRVEGRPVCSVSGTRSAC